MKRQDISGMVFGRLTVIGPTEYRYNRNVLWKCICSCGKETLLTAQKLTRGNTKSCGCWNVEHRQLLPGHAALNRLYTRYQKGARHRKIVFSLSKEEFSCIVVQQCFYCGDLPYSLMRDSNKRFHGNFYYTGIDRINNNKGYETGNVVPCCQRCNYAKRDMTFDAFVSWAKRLNEGLIERDIRKALRGSTQSMSTLKLGET